MWGSFEIFCIVRDKEYITVIYCFMGIISNKFKFKLLKSQRSQQDIEVILKFKSKACAD